MRAWAILFCFSGLVMIASGGAPFAQTNVATSPAMLPPSSVQTLTADLSSGHVRFDLYLPPSAEPRPLVIVAHGWLRDRTRMVGWGQRLSEEGFVAAVPDLPTVSDHPRNGRAMNELIAWLCANAPASAHIDKSRIGMLGYSAGGLSTLLAAADNHSVRIWVGLDPVELRNLGAAAAQRFHRTAVVVRAPPSSWNHEGNAALLMHALPKGCVDLMVPNAIHIDPEWPTDWQAELVMGKSSEARREQFVKYALGALKAELLETPATVAHPTTRDVLVQH